MAVNILERLDGVRATGAEKYLARCPAHADKRPSLSVRLVPDGRVLLHCWVGCEVEAILNALGLTFTDLMPERIGGVQGLPRLRPAFTARDAMEVLVEEGGYLAVFGADEAEGVVPTAAELDRLAVSVRRIYAALEFCYGSR